MTMIHPPEAGLDETSFILCHLLVTLPESQLEERPEGFVTGPKMIEVQAARKRALNLP